MAGIVTQKDNVRLFIWDADAQVTKADKVGNITQLGDIGGETEDVDVTTIESLAREYENGFDDNGTVDITQNLTTNEYTTMSVRKDAGESLNWGISAFNKKGQQVLGLHGKGLIKSAKLTGISVGGLLQATSSLRVNGAINNDFVDPIGYIVGKAVEKIEVAGMGGASTIDTKGGTLQVIATITPSDATNKAVTWSVDQPTLADISTTGLLNAKGDGAVKVTATAKDGSGVKGETTITISSQTE